MSLGKLLKPTDVKGDTAYDIIWRAWMGHKVEELNPETRAILTRWQDVDRLYKRGELVAVPNTDRSATKRFTWRAIVEWLIEQHGISVRQAYEDVANAKRFFLCAEGRTDVEYARGAALEHGRMAQWAAFDAGDFAAFAMIFKECNKVEGLHEQTSDLPIYAEFQAPKIVVVAKASELGFEEIDDIDGEVKKILAERKQTYIDETAEDIEEEPPGE